MNKIFYMGFFAILWTPWSWKKIFTTWNLLKSEVYLTCIDFWKFHDYLKACLEVIRLRSWPENVKYSVKMQFFTFLTPWKISFWINDKIWNLLFSESGHGSVPILLKPIFLFQFSNFKGYPENPPNHILSSNSAGKILKIAIKSELHGLCNWNFWNFLFQWDYQMAIISRILKFLTWHWFDEFGMNYPIYS